MAVLVTGVAGFIGMHVAAALLKRGERVVGVDDMNAYYPVALKEARLATLAGERGFAFHRLDLAEREGLSNLVRHENDIDAVVHLAAQAGVRYSLENPRAYVSANIVGQLELLEACRAITRLRHLVFASSSSVYGANAKLPFSVRDPADQPQSLYAATKKADELMAYTYAHLYGIPTTGLRFFTVYGPWGRPDMAPWIFTEAIIDDAPLKLFNFGRMQRDFTYINDVVAGVVACLDQPPARDMKPPFRLYNLGNSRCEELERFVEVLEQAIGKRAMLQLMPMQPGDVEATYADIASATRDFGYSPKTTIDEGLPRFVAWYRQYRGL